MKWSIVFSSSRAKVHAADCKCRGRIDEALRRGPNVPAPESVEAPDLAAAFASDAVTVLIRRGWTISPARCAEKARAFPTFGKPDASRPESMTITGNLVNTDEEAGL